jgi:hypothetical protein
MSFHTYLNTPPWLFFRSSRMVCFSCSAIFLKVFVGHSVSSFLRSNEIEADVYTYLLPLLKKSLRDRLLWFGVKHIKSEGL